MMRSDNRQFRHLDPSALKVYTQKTVYGIETERVCLLIAVKNGYVVETPKQQDLKWIRGQHIETLIQFYNIKPLRIASTGKS
jgi:hypothetical protein